MTFNSQSDLKDGCALELVIDMRNYRSRIIRGREGRYTRNGANVGPLRVIT